MQYFFCNKEHSTQSYYIIRCKISFGTAASLKAFLIHSFLLLPAVYFLCHKSAKSTLLFSKRPIAFEKNVPTKILEF